MADLDLSNLVRQPYTVALPDNNVYEMADPMEMSAHQYHVFLSRKKTVDDMFKEGGEWSDEDVEKMEQILDDICCAILPEAPREVVCELGFRRQRLLIETFAEQAPQGENGQGKAVSHSE